MTQASFKSVLGFLGALGLFFLELEAGTEQTNGRTDWVTYGIQEGGHHS